MNPADLKALQNPMLVLLAVVLAGAGVVYYSDLQRKQAAQQLARQDTQFRAARTRLQKSGEEKDIIVRYLGGYQQLQRTGFAGDEQRINWLDGLRLANQQADLFGVDYQIGVQQPYPYTADLNPGQLVLSQSVMKLRFRLLHEEDLMRFFNALARQGVGMFTIDQCIVRRIETGGVIRYQPNLSAECEISWITARAGGEKKP